MKVYGTTAVGGRKADVVMLLSTASNNLSHAHSEWRATQKLIAWNSP